MAGLLGMMDDPQSQGLLSLGLRLMSTPGNFGTALGQAGLGAMGDMQAAMQMQEQRKRQEQASLMQKLQLEQMLEAQKRQKMAGEAAQAAAQRKGAYLDTLGGMQGPGMPFDPMSALSAGLDPQMIKFMAEAPNLGRSKVARTIERRGADGRPEVVQVDEFGREVGSAMPQAVKLQLENMGGSSQAVDPYSLTPGQQFRRTQSPDSAASTAVTMRGQNMTDARAREANAVQMQNGKIPQGYRMKLDGSLEAIPGGPADIKSGELGAKAEAKKAGTISQANSVLDTISDAKNLVGYNTAGVGSWLTALPATDARNLAAKLETVKANLGFDRLQQMRDQSPTGGALGAVAVQELTALQSTVASLDQAQSPAQLEKALTKIEGHYGKWLEVMGAPRKTPKLDLEQVYKDADRIINGGR